MKIPPDDLIERLRRATGDADTAQLLEAAANRLEELDIECATLRHGLRLANRRADEAADRLRQEEIMGQVLRAAQGERQPVYGCHCDLEPDMEPDGCVIDDGWPGRCVYAKGIERKEQCAYWQPIAVMK